MKLVCWYPALDHILLGTHRAISKLTPTTTVWICVENQAGTPLMTARLIQPRPHLHRVALVHGPSLVSARRSRRPSQATEPGRALH